ncbi:hypothetical protein DPM19_31195 [Actinomadura craniellae]|uniref:DUF1963 domain-containing protein n=1 Tax=Actinomadura craniellae TaxID=2231787 RepID=A0A365GWM7_9ACTN|nr:hypothetical protein DPM19_31195 [Actinomadura craniellae]
MDVAREVPGMGAYARTVVRLHPRPGSPGVRDSHIGGPFLWPAGEEWPHCAEPKYAVGSGRNVAPERPVAMTAVAQLYAADLPELAFPPGKDLFQLLWCPGHHPATSYNPAFRLIWRRADEVTEVLAEPPVPHLVADTSYVPRPCALHPERVTEYPWHEELPPELQVRLKGWDAGEPLYQDWLSVVPGCKVGGGMSWEVTDMPPTECGTCGAPAGLLLQLDSTEWYGRPGETRWQPLEEEHLAPGTAEYRDAHEPTGLKISQFSHGGFFQCTASFDHPPFYLAQ